jgi:hypothetical protein
VETSSHPNRRRRWLIVAALALVALGGGLWRFWPRVDQRFVGKWRSGRSESILESSGFTNQFRATADDGGGLGLNQRLRWQVRNGRFEILSYDSSLKNWVLNSYYRWQRSRQDERIFEGTICFGAEVVEVTEDSFVLRNGPRRYRFQRVTD